MSEVFLITGEVEHPLTIDPSVWIFDERKIELELIFKGEIETENAIEKYTKSVSKHWDREIIEGAKVDTSIPFAQTKKQWLEKTYVMPFSYFIDNSKPKSREENVTIETEKSTITLPFKTVYESYLAFSNNGKRIVEEGPVHLYFKDGSNKDTPITSIQRIIF